MSLRRRLNKIQTEAVDLALKYFQRRKCGHIVMPTGSGKTVTCIKFIKKSNFKRILWLTQTDELIDQTYSVLSKNFKGRFKKNISIYRRSELESKSDIVIASVQTLTKDKNLNSIPKNNFDLVVVDECHHSLAKSWLKIINYFSYSKKLGLTATPFRMSGVGLEEVFGKIIYELPYEEAIEKKLIAKPIPKRVICSNNLADFKLNKNKEYSKKALQELAKLKTRSDIIAEVYKRDALPRLKRKGLPQKTICYCVTVEHAIEMVSIFKEKKVKADFIVGDQGIMSLHKRQEIYQDFLTTDKIEVLCVVNILNEGKDIPSVSCLLLGRPTGSAIIYPQQLGRGIRFIDDLKEECLVYDFVDNIKRSFQPFDYPEFSKFALKKEDIILGFDLIDQEFPEFWSEYESLDDYVENMHSNIEKYRNDFIYQKGRFDKKVKDWVKKHGSISCNDFTRKNKMPSRRDIERFYGTLNNCIKSLNLPVKLRTQEYTEEITDRQILVSLKKLVKRKGVLRGVDINNKNGTVSIKIIRKRFGSMKGLHKKMREEFPELF